MLRGTGIAPSLRERKKDEEKRKQKTRSTSATSSPLLKYAEVQIVGMLGVSVVQESVL
jgi:hypothetical protein